MLERVNIIETTKIWYETNILPYFVTKGKETPTVHAGRPLGQAKNNSIHIDIMSDRVASNVITYELGMIISLSSGYSQIEASELCDFIVLKFTSISDRIILYSTLESFSIEKFDSFEELPISILLTANLKLQLTQKNRLMFS